MTTTYECWDLDNGDPDEGNLEEMEGLFDDDEGGAAEEFAEKLFDGGDPFESATIAVRKKGATEWKRFTVSVDYDPTFYAKRITEGKAP